MPDLFTFRGVYLPTGPENPGTSLTLRVRGDPEQARQALLERLTSVDPGLGHDQHHADDGRNADLRPADRLLGDGGPWRAGARADVVGPVQRPVVRRRAAGEGDWRAHGARRDARATSSGLVLSQSLRPVGIGLVAGGGLAAALAIVLMSTPAASQIGAVVHVFDPVAYAASLLLIVTSCVLAASVPAVRAARLDPIATLRND